MRSKFAKPPEFLGRKDRKRALKIWCFRRCSLTNMDIVLVALGLKEVKHAVEVSAGSVYEASAQLVLYFFTLLPWRSSNTKRSGGRCVRRAHESGRRLAYGEPSGRRTPASRRRLAPTPSRASGIRPYLEERSSTRRRWPPTKAPKRPTNFMIAPTNTRRAHTPFSSTRTSKVR